jgi:hydrogenase nickel incorporation protein HypB
MCAICGCDDHHEHEHADGTRHSHAGAHEHHAHEHHHVSLETRVLAKNDALAEKNSAWLAQHGVAAINLMGAPGCGKTSLLERSIRSLGAAALAVIEGDQATANDAQRIRSAGARVIQINTGTGCHLDAAMVAQALAELAAPPGTVVVIENVGNLVCPALFRLGEQRRVVLLSVAEGDDKPLKYPHMFRAAELVLISKVDLLPHVDFSLECAAVNIRTVNPGALVLEVSARTGAGLEDWYRWLREPLEGLGDRRERGIQSPAHAAGIER